MHAFASSIPLLLLVDSQCASGAEIIAWALRDNDRAQVWGDSRTFGKASAQVCIYVCLYVCTLSSMLSSNYTHERYIVVYSLILNY
jgi:C-terminal processing protease CtpA/Prc